MNVTHIKAVAIVKTVHSNKTTYAFRLGRWQYPMAISFYVILNAIAKILNFYYLASVSFQK